MYVDGRSPISGLRNTGLSGCGHGARGGAGAHQEELRREGVPRHALRVRGQLPPRHRALGLPGVDDGDGAVEARREEDGRLGGVPLHRLHLARLVVLRAAKPTFGLQSSV